MSDPTPPMKRTRSPAQIEASRRNGAKSRGPVTPEGKAIASRNGMRHGLCAHEQTATADEDAADLRRFRRQFRRDLAARGFLGDTLVERLADAFWRLARADRAERRSFDGLYGYGPAEKTASLDTIVRYRAQASRDLFRVLEHLRADQRTHDPMTLRSASPFRQGPRRTGR